MLFIAIHLNLFHKKLKSFRDICQCFFYLKYRYSYLRGKNEKTSGSFRINSTSTKTSNLDSQTSHDKTKYTPIK